MFIDFLIEIFHENYKKDAIIWNDLSFTYNWLLDNINEWVVYLKQDIPPGSVVAIESNTTPWSMSLMLALIENQNIIVPVTQGIDSKKNELIELSKCDFSISVKDDGKYETKHYSFIGEYELYQKLKNAKHPGLVLFTSGTSGKSKASVHDFTRLLLKYKTKRKDFITLQFMLYDHIGGVDTLFYSISNGSTVVLLNERTPSTICKAIERHRIEVLPTTPTFLRLLIISEAYKKHDLSSLKYITYGTEPMPKTILDKCKLIFPQVTILQKYGTTEVGTLRSKSQNSTSTWVKIGGEGYKTRIVDGLLQIKAESAMLGYLNAPSPFTDDGWFITGDKVEEKNGFIRILGRDSEIINVGGEKVYPAEVENVILELDFVEDVTVYGQSNAIMGNIVCADINIRTTDISENEYRRKIKDYCRSKLENFKVPVKIFFKQNAQFSNRYKKNRSQKK